ncbi:MAG: adenylate kinase [Candidatus Woesearchaeota archaeon]|jgi:adenylate kinase
MIIVVSGTPGTGKTTFAKALALELSAHYVSVTDFALENELTDGYDDERDCYILDEVRIEQALKVFAKENNDLVIDSHMAHEFGSWVDIVLVCTCDLKVLKSRLQARGYAENKVQENMQVEIFDTCYIESLEKGHQTIKIKNEGDVKELIRPLLSRLSSS